MRRHLKAISNVLLDSAAKLTVDFWFALSPRHVGQMAQQRDHCLGLAQRLHTFWGNVRPSCHGRRVDHVAIHIHLGQELILALESRDSGLMRVGDVEYPRSWPRRIVVAVD